MSCRLTAFNSTLIPPTPATNADTLSLFAKVPDWLTAPFNSSGVLTALGRHVPEFASRELELRECEIKRVKLEHKSQTALYRLTYVRRSTGHERIAEVLGVIVSPGATEPRSGANGAPFDTDG